MRLLDGQKGYCMNLNECDFKNLEISKTNGGLYRVVVKIDNNVITIPRLSFHGEDFISILNSIVNKQDNIYEHNSFININLNGTMLATLDENNRPMYYNVHKNKEK